MKLKKAKGAESDNANSPRTVEDCLGLIEKKYGKGIIRLMTDNTIVKTDVVSTGSYALDEALIIGGLPRGRVVEIFGAESSGKTNIALNVIAEAQKMGLQCAFIDAEHSLSPEMATGTGVDLDKLILSQPDSGEQALDIVEILVKSGSLGVIVVDSVAALVPQAELDGEMIDQQMGLQARMLGKGLRKLSGHVAKTKTCLIFINQLRAKIGAMFGSPTDTPGGKALKFFASIRLDVKKIVQIKQGDAVIGNSLKIIVVKNKLAPPFRTAETELRFGKGFSRSAELFERAFKLELIEKDGNTYTFGEEKIGVGRASTLDLLDSNQELFNRILEKVREESNGR